MTDKKFGSELEQDEIFAIAEKRVNSWDIDNIIEYAITAQMDELTSMTETEVLKLLSEDDEINQ